MADRNEKVLLELTKYPGNGACADCGSRSKLKKVVFWHQGCTSVMLHFVCK